MNNCVVWSGRCHCGAVCFKAMLSDDLATIRRCDCSYCRMRGAVVAATVAGGVEVLQGSEALTSYRYHTGVTQNFFCARCGVYTHHQRRSNPTSYAVNVVCLDGVSPFDFAEVPVMDGAHHPVDTGRPARRVGSLRFRRADA